MMRKLVLGFSLVLALASCDSAQEAVDDAARVTAKATIEKVLTAHLPESIPAKLVTPYSDCVIEAATSSELFSLSRDAVTGVDAGTIALVTELMQRRTATKCIAEATLAQLSL